MKQFFARPRAASTPMEDPFIQFDRAKAIERMRLSDHGTENGAEELPDPGTSAFDGIEAEIVADINEHYSRAQIDAATQLRTYEQRIADLTLLAELSSIKAQARLAVSDFGAEVLITNNKLANSRDAIRSSYSHLRAFRQQHGISRPAKDIQHKAALGGAILSAWLIETIANTAFLRVNDEMGWLGGAVAAAIVAAINVFVSAVVGRLIWPRALSVDRTTRYAARSMIILWFALLLTWSIAAAHYRDAKAAGSETPEVEALILFQNHLFTFDSLYSWGLLAIGIVFAMLSALSGFNMDDPYPGYGEVSRAHDERCHAYTDQIADATDRLRDIRESAVTEAEEVRSQLSIEFRERDRILIASNAFRKRYEEFTLQLEQAGNMLLETYRTANRRARTTPPPAHFNSYWTIAKTSLQPIIGGSTPDTEIKAAERELDAAIAAISDAFDAAVRSFEPLDTLKQRLSDG